MLDNGNTAVAADPERDVIHFVDLASEARTTVSVPRGAEPTRLAQSPELVHVVLFGAGQVRHAIDGSPERARRAFPRTTPTSLWCTSLAFARQN